MSSNDHACKRRRSQATSRSSFRDSIPLLPPGSSQYTQPVSSHRPPLPPSRLHPVSLQTPYPRSGSLTQPRQHLESSLSPRGHPGSLPQPPYRAESPPPSPPLSPRQPASAELSISRPHHDFLILHHFDDLVNFLLKNRPQNIPGFIADCWKLYNSKYKRHKPTNSTQRSLPDSSNTSNHNGTENSGDRSYEIERSGRYDTSYPDGRSYPDDTRHPNDTRHPDDIRHPDDRWILGERRHTEERKPKHFYRHKSTANSQQPVKHPDLPHPPPIPRSFDSLTGRNPFHPSHYPLIDRQAHLEQLVYQRWNTFHTKHPQLPRHPTPKSCTPQQNRHEINELIIWQSPKSPIDRIVLDPKHCCLALQDQKSNISSIHVNALTFLWHTLIANPCTGAVFNHGIGYPRTHIIFLFAHLVLTSPNRQKYTILIICSPATRTQWEMTSEHFTDKVNINILTESRWQENTTQWKAQGGVLIVDDNSYNSILKNELENENENTKESAVVSALCCPGPDICILDEAANLNTSISSVYFRRFLHRTRTKARLALTSLPLAGFIQRTWPIVNWACPRLFGTNIEYHTKFVEPIARGHKRDATASQTAEAFRKACVLFNKISMVTFTLDATTRRESLTAKGLNLHESIVWVNISHEEYKIYRAVELFLSAAVKQRELSPFLAINLMVCAASNVNALRCTLQTWAEATPRCLQAISDQTQGLFQRLLQLVESLLHGDLISTKLQLVLRLATECLRKNERLVIFATSQDHLEDVHKLLTSDLDKTKIYTCEAFVHNEPQENRSLAEFNITQGGAVLAALYGPTIQCMEDSGWGFINATRIIFIDSSWHSGACVQAINRVHNFAQMNTDLHVHYFLSRKTVEFDLYSDLERQYRHMLNCDRSMFPETIYHLDEKSFLIAPQIKPQMIRDSLPEDFARLAITSVKREDNHERNTSAAIPENDDMIFLLENTNHASNGERYVHAIIIHSDRYRSMSENLDLCMRVEWSGKARFLAEAIGEANYCELVKSYRKSLHELGGYATDAVHRGLAGEWLAQESIFMEQDIRVPDLMTSWWPYRRLFEFPRVSKIPRLPPNAGQKRARPKEDNVTDLKNQRSVVSSDHMFVT